MKKLALVLAVGTAALFGGSAANAADNSVKSNAGTGVTNQSTDISSQRRHRHHGHRHHGFRHHHHHHRHFGYRHYRPYYGSSYGYAPRPYYGYGGPVISFGFGGGRW
jgi:hypothetical protein